jgi:hypothetical protein
VVWQGTTPLDALEGAEARDCREIPSRGENGVSFLNGIKESKTYNNVDE